MNHRPSEGEILVRYLYGQASPDEGLQAAELLRANREARDFLREVAEQAVMIADLARSAEARRRELLHRPASEHDSRRGARIRPWHWALATAAALVLAALAVIELFPADKPLVIRVAKASGSSLLFGTGGVSESALDAGALLRAGDTLETRSCDAWIELLLRDGSRLTIGGHSELRLLEEESGLARLNLLRGTLWISPAHGRSAESLLIQTPTVSVDSRGVQLDVQSSATETLVRVNSGTARVRQHLDGSSLDVPAGHQVMASLDRSAPMAVLPQPEPIDSWACDLGRVPQVLVGRWLPTDELEGARLGAEPLLWPLPGRDPVLLYAAALSVLSSADRPVLLRPGSELVFRGLTERPQTVRFGFSTQRMQGAFSGKFEMDVRPESLGPAGETWEVRLPLADFRSLQPQLSFTPDGLELTDVYALTIREDAGLEINHIELVPPGAARP